MHYAPNDHNPNFLSLLTKTLLDFKDYYLIIGGDFNQVCNPDLDKSSGFDKNVHPPGELNIFMEELNVIDAWRSRNSH